MESEYAVIEDIKAEKRYEDSPVEILRFQRLRHKETGEISLCYTMRNIGEKVIKAVHLSIFCYDCNGNQVDEIAAFEYKKIFAKKGECFAWDDKIVLHMKNAEKFDLFLNHVFYDDKTVWNSQRILNLEHPQQRMSEHPSFEVMKFACKKAKIARNAKYIPDIIDRFWRCTCGQMNQSNAKQCIKCKTDRTLLNKVFHEEYLKEMEGKLEERNKRVKKKAKEKKIREKLEKNTRSIKYLGKKAIPIAVVGIVLTAFVFWGKEIVFPTYHYEKAKKALESGMYVEAKQQFEKSGAYKEAEKFSKYTNILTKLEQVQEKMNLGELYNEIIDLDGFQGINMLLSENFYLKQMKALQGEWVRYNGSQKEVYKISDGTMSLNGKNVCKILAVGRGIGIQGIPSKKSEEITKIISVTENEIVAKTEQESNVIVFHRREEGKESMYFPVNSYQKVLQKMLQDRHKVIEQMKKESSVYACFNLIQYLYGEAYTPFVKLKKACFRNLDDAKQLTLTDGTTVEYQKEVYIDIVKNEPEDLNGVQEQSEKEMSETEKVGQTKKREHYVGYFDLKGETLLAYNKLETEISNKENNKKLVNKFNAYEIPNIAIPICKQVIEMEMEKEGYDTKDSHFFVTAVNVEKLVTDGLILHIWGTDAAGMSKKMEGTVNYTYQIEGSSIKEEAFYREDYVGTPVYDYAQQLASYLR